MDAGYEKLKLYSRYNSWEEFNHAVDIFCEETHQPFVKRSSKKVDSFCVYQTYACTHRGVFSPRGKGLRDTKSGKDGCSAKIHACLWKEDKSKIIVTVLQDMHNHEIAPMSYRKHVKRKARRKSEQAMTQYIKDLNIPPKSVRQEMCSSITGQEITMQDIHNGEIVSCKAEPDFDSTATLNMEVYPINEDHHDNMAPSENGPEGSYTVPSQQFNIQRFQKRKQKSVDVEASALKQVRDCPGLGYNSRKKESPKHEDYFDISGKGIGGKLRLLPRNQRIFAERLISDVLFNAEFGYLSRSCHLELGITTAYASTQTWGETSSP